LTKIKINDDNWTALKLELSSILTFNAFSNKKLNKQFPTLGTIYHYTSLEGLISIIEDQSLYCTNIHFLNDKKEYQYGVDLILKVIEGMKSEDNYFGVINMIMKKIDLIYKSERYVTCFSKNGDLLSQWRAYGNDGKGVSIGFKSIDFESSVYQFLNGNHIEYNEDIQLEVVGELIRLIIDFFHERKEIIDWAEYGYELLVANVVIEFLNNIISSYKHPSFSEEQEYRFEYKIDGNIIKEDDEELLFRASGSLIAPYIKIKGAYKKYMDEKKAGKYKESGADPTFALKQLPIVEIIIGPSSDYDMLKMGIESLLRKNKYNGVLIEKSKVPYRI